MTDSERIKKVIEWSNLTPNAFSDLIGYASSQSIYNIMSGSRPINTKVATYISNHFPIISKSWLLTGEGKMLNSEISLEKKPPEDPPEELSNQSIMTRLVLSNEKLVLQNGELIKILAKQTSIIEQNSNTINNNSNTINNLSYNVQGDTSKNVSGGAA